MKYPRDRFPEPRIVSAAPVELAAVLTDEVLIQPSRGLGRDAVKNIFLFHRSEEAITPGTTGEQPHLYAKVEPVHHLSRLFNRVGRPDPVPVRNLTPLQQIPIAGEDDPMVRQSRLYKGGILPSAELHCIEPEETKESNELP